MVECPPDGPDGHPVSIVGLDSSIIQNPRVWEASGHVGGFNDPMVDCRESKARYRADHLGFLSQKGHSTGQIFAFVSGDESSLGKARKRLEKYIKAELDDEDLEVCSIDSLSPSQLSIAVGPDAKEAGTLTEPRQFNLMFKTYVAALQDEDAAAYLRPGTAQGIFLNFKNVCDTSRVRVPFGIAQIGKAFRNEVTPRNFIFRSREFEQMELEFFATVTMHQSGMNSGVKPEELVGHDRSKARISCCGPMMPMNWPLRQRWMRHVRRGIPLPLHHPRLWRVGRCGPPLELRPLATCPACRCEIGVLRPGAERTVSPPRHRALSRTVPRCSGGPV